MYQNQAKGNKEDKFVPLDTKEILNDLEEKKDEPTPEE